MLVYQNWRGGVLFSLNGILPLHFLPDCKDLPAIRNATCVERFGLYRNIGRGSKFKCNVGFSMLGRPFSVCKTDGHWQNMFACVENRMFKFHDKYNFNKFLSSFQSFDCNHWKPTDSTTLTAKHNHLIKQSKYFSNIKIKQKTRWRRENSNKIFYFEMFVIYDFSFPSRNCNVTERLAYKWLWDLRHVGAFDFTSSK